MKRNGNNGNTEMKKLLVRFQEIVFVCLLPNNIYYDSIHKSARYGDWQFFLYMRARIDNMLMERTLRKKMIMNGFLSYPHNLWLFLLRYYYKLCHALHTMIYEYERSYIIALNFTSEQIYISNSMWVCCCCMSDRMMVVCM